MFIISNYAKVCYKTSLCYGMNWKHMKGMRLGFIAVIFAAFNARFDLVVLTTQNVLCLIVAGLYQEI